MGFWQKIKNKLHIINEQSNIEEDDNDDKPHNKNDKIKTEKNETKIIRSIRYNTYKKNNLKTTDLENTDISAVNNTSKIYSHQNKIRNKKNKINKTLINIFYKHAKLYMYIDNSKHIDNYHFHIVLPSSVKSIINEKHNSSYILMTLSAYFLAIVTSKPFIDKYPTLDIFLINNKQYFVNIYCNIIPMLRNKFNKTIFNVPYEEYLLKQLQSEYISRINFIGKLNDESIIDIIEKDFDTYINKNISIITDIYKLWISTNTLTYNNETIKNESFKLDSVDIDSYAFIKDIII